jgi:O-antigen/teichoic acid export membrane protein
MPSRSNRFISGLVSGYGSIAANVIFTMTSIPLALHYLEKEQFGLWALAVQINGYLGLIDLGMSSAVSRFIADYKDDVDGGEYGSHLLTGAFVFLVQGVLIALAGMVFSWFAPQAFAIPNHLAHEFELLILILTSTTGLSVFLRSAGAPLWAFQRNDVVYGCASVGLFLMLGLLWIGFHLGWGVMSFAIAQIPMLICTILAYTWVCIRNHYYPSPGKWRAPSLTIFWKIFHFGKDNLLISMGAQLTSASQIMIISRWISLDAAATFSIATKFYAMSMQLTTNPVSASAPGLAELWIRNERKRFVSRYWDLISIVLFISTVAAVGLTIGNKALISIWTQTDVQWTGFGDFMLGLMIIVRNINGCFLGLFGITKNWGPVKFIPLAEGVAFVTLAILLNGRFGLDGILLISLIAHLAITSLLSSRAAKSVIGSSTKIALPLMASLAYTGIWFAITWTTSLFGLNNYTVLAIAILSGIISIATMWKITLPRSLREQVIHRIKGFTSALG